MTVQVPLDQQVDSRFRRDVVYGVLPQPLRPGQIMKLTRPLIPARNSRAAIPADDEAGHVDPSGDYVIRLGQCRVVLHANGLETLARICRMAA